MKRLVSLKKLIFIVFLSLFVPLISVAQTQLPLPLHNNVYCGMARGFWFLAPEDLTITGLMVAPEAGTGFQHIHVVNCFEQFPISTSGTTNFITLEYITGAANNTLVPVNIQVQQGDQIGILGTVTGNCNSYAPSQTTTSNIGTHSIFLNRFGYQGSIESGAAPAVWGHANGASSAIGRIIMYYQLAGPTDAGLETFIFPSDTICEGTDDVLVELKNHGPEPLIKVDIYWDVNDSLQPLYEWTGNLPVNGVDTVTIGSYYFLPSVQYDVTAYTCSPNQYIDTINNANDTISISGFMVNPLPFFTPDTSSYLICSGDSVNITGTLVGIPPWDVVIDDGSSIYNFNNLSSPQFSFYAKPSFTSTYSFVSISDATHCDNLDPLNITVGVMQSPPANITTHGSPTYCEGDSITLMGSIGLNFSYRWFKDGIEIPGDTTYALVVKTSGDYTVEVMNPAGCLSVSTPYSVLFNPAPEVFIGNDTNIAPGESLTLDAGAGFQSYNWSTGETSQTITIDSSGIGLGTKTIWVRVIDNNDCPGTDTINVTFVHNPGIFEVSSTAQIKIFPNPASENTELLLKDFPQEKVIIELYCSNGQLVWFKKKVPNKEKESVNIDLSGFSDGLYFLRIGTATLSIGEKIIIRK